MTVLVLTAEWDAVADVVVAELGRRRASVVRLNPADVPTKHVVDVELDPGSRSGWNGVWRGQHRDLNLGEVRAVYWRRPGAVRVHAGMGPEVTGWAEAESQAAVGGLLRALPAVVWVNHPDANAVMASQPRAMAAAAACGLTVPRTLITNNPQRAREWIAALPAGAAAYKAIGGGRVCLDNTLCTVWTSRVTPGDITDGLALVPHYLTEWIDKAYEVRLTAVGDRLFAAEIHAGSDASRMDFRRDYEALTYRACEVPQEVAAGVCALMRRGALRYAALDFLVNGDGGWICCDVNPNGQFGWISEIRHSITEALVDALLEERP